MVIVWCVEVVLVNFVVVFCSIWWLGLELLVIDDGCVFLLDFRFIVDFFKE